MKTYQIQVKHDTGSTVLSVRAGSISAAQDMVCAAEGCPKSALGYWAVVPTTKHVKSTQNLLRCI
jgi:hypothetical protein